ncbi:flagellar hook-associated protein FlgL [Sinanaerobacter chloroacetimidivorans]|uniref:Flagellar hook-associated protein FlgL n=1 Tax=Sinanaerobacter chloroacetimidivorans TaxID=2818044 RepID=A0A8J8B1C6_9FIRM|nr:flagellar hook-associated protein FlgL [Sinanaerobacter chloroacetimidivorans]MBR0597521.1 flagellar hook-associated protein FlgL [Sinanaerobacter chloroacetimidivorans]
MRITNKMITNKYIRTVNTLSYDLDKLNTQVASGRKFMKASENTSAAVKAFQIRRDMSSVEGYQANIEHANASLTNAESALNHMEELMQEAREKILAAQNGTNSQEERKVIATQIKNIQQQLLQTLNSQASDVYYFGGSNTDTPPFSIDTATGSLMYNGNILNDIVSGSDEEKALASDSMYVDIGLGLQIIPDPNDLTKTIVDPKSVFQYTLPGINIVGSGTTTVDGVTVSNNLYDLLGQIASGLESDTYTYESVDILYGQFTKTSAQIVYGLTEVGAKTSYLEFMKGRYETSTLNNQERQLSIEGADPTSTIIKFKSQEVAYQAALQMGTQIIQPSIFDYLR